MRRVRKTVAAHALRENSDLSIEFPVFEGGEEVAEEVQAMVSGNEISPGPETEWAGLWRVSYAPHISTLGSLSLTKYDVYYDIAPPIEGESPEMQSFVRFEGPFWRGWLNAAGRISTLSDSEVQVEFKDFWIDSWLCLSESLIVAY